MQLSSFLASVPFVLGVSFVLAVAQDQPEPKLPVPRQIVEAACGECQLGMEGKGCDLAVRIAGSTFFVDGSGIDDHGDAHAADGLCNKIRKALVSGRLQNGRFIAEEFRLLASPDSPATLLSNEEIFLKVWSTVHERFYRADFGGVDWERAKAEYLPQANAAGNPDELAAVINQMLGLLKTSHTGFYTRDDVEFYFLADIFSAGPLGLELLPHFPEGRVSFAGIGIFSKSIDGKWFISGVVDGGPAGLAGLRRGQQLIAVDRQPFHPIRSFAGKVGREVSIEIQSTGEPSSRSSISVTPIEIEPQAFMRRAMEQSMRVIDVNGKRIGYVRIWSYAGQNFQDLLIDAVTSGSLASADALIIDLRDGWGGADPEYLQLFNRQIPRMTSIDRNGERTGFDAHWRKPVALLVNEGTRSGKELIAYGFRKSGIGPVIGTRTAGAVVAGSVVMIDPECLLYLAVQGVEVDGEVLEGRGVEPDHVVPYELPYAAEVDPQLNRATEVLGRGNER